MEQPSYKLEIFEGPMDLLLHLISKLYYYPFVYAPVKKGDVIGYACINQITVPMRAQEDIEIYATEE